MDGDLVVGDIHLGSIAGLNLEISLADNVACLSRVGSQVGFVDCNIVTLSILDPHGVGGGLQKLLPLVRSESYGIDWLGARREVVVLSFQVLVRLLLHEDLLLQSHDTWCDASQVYVDGLGKSTETPYCGDARVSMGGIVKKMRRCMVSTTEGIFGIRKRVATGGIERVQQEGNAVCESEESQVARI
jgi:hypothetical protein